MRERVYHNHHQIAHILPAPLSASVPRVITESTEHKRSAAHAVMRYGSPGLSCTQLARG
jgi:hypothetical protein